jgi:hypothetical protein
MTSSEIEPTTFRPVALCLYQLRYRVPHCLFCTTFNVGSQLRQGAQYNASYKDRITFRKNATDIRKGAEIE